LELEQQTRLSSQYPAWPEKREAWRTAVRAAASVRDLAEPLIEFEISIKSEAQGGTWSTRRQAWINEVRAAQTLSALADLLAEFETPISWEALEDGWRTRRGGWYSEVMALKNTPAAAPAAAPTGTGSPSDFGRLLREFEQQTRITAQVPLWSEKRQAWVAAAQSATTVPELAGSLALFGVSIKWEVMNEGWVARIGSLTDGNLSPGWMREVGAATNLITLVDLLIELETATKWEATEDGWRTRRDGWLAELRALKSTSGSSAPATPVASRQASSASQQTSSPRVEPVNGTGSAQYWMNLASETTDKGKKINYLTKAIDAWVPADGVALKASAYFARGVARHQTDFGMEEIEDYTRSIALDSAPWLPYHYRAWAHYFRREYREASEDHERTIAPNAGTAGYYSSLAVTRMLEGLLTKSLEASNRSLKIDANFAQSYTNRGFAFFDLDKLEESASGFERAIQLAPDGDASPYVGLALVRWRQGDLVEARKLMAKALKIAPDINKIPLWMTGFRHFTPKQVEVIAEIRAAP
jgi:tetratricopeptide (TPR) repeat protein